jgi:adenine-specific DNA-methyltransferase
VFVLQKGAKVDTLQIERDNDRWQMNTNDWQTSKLLIVDHRLRPQVREIIQKIRSGPIAPLVNYGEVIQGITPYDRYRGQDVALIQRRGYHALVKMDETYGMWLNGQDVSRYRLNWSGEWLSYGPWLGAPREPRFFDGARLLFREVPGPAKRIQATFAQTLYYYGHSITPFKLFESVRIDERYILGLTNSRLLSWYGGLTLPNFGKDVFPKLNPQDIKELPIRTIDPTNPADKKQHDAIVSLVEQMLSLHKQLAEARNPQDKTFLQTRIDATDRQIDRLVYDLYGLTPDEIKIVEAGTK